MYAIDSVAIQSADNNDDGRDGDRSYGYGVDVNSSILHVR